jgi:hypothetical protein
MKPGISLLFNNYDVANEERQYLMVVMMCGALISIGGYNYLKNRKGVVVMIVGVIVLGLARRGDLADCVINC